MKLRRKSSIAFLLVLCLLLELLPGVALAAEPSVGLENFTESNAYTPGQFADVAESSWYYENVKSVYEFGLMVGKSSNSFDPNGNITLAEAITIAVRLHATYHGNTFSPSKTAPWYQPYVDYADKNNIVQSAYSDYNRAATRAQFVTILSGALPESVFEEINQIADNAIPDVKTTDTGAKGIYLFYRAGILTGNDNSGTFAPTFTIRRSETAAIITRMVKPELRVEVTLSEGKADISTPNNSHGIYSKELDPEHVKTGTLTFEGQSYEGQYIDNEVVVVAADTAKRDDIVRLTSGYGGKIVGEIPDVGYYQIELDTIRSAAELEKLAAELMKEKVVEDAYVNTVTEYGIDAYYPDDYQDEYKDSVTAEYPFAEASEGFWKNSPYVAHFRVCNVPEAWDLVRSANQNPSIRMGVIDACMDAQHQDLKFEAVFYRLGSYDPRTVGSTKPHDSGVEHGTHVAGIMGAKNNNGIGVSGVALNATLFGVSSYTMMGSSVSEYQRAEDTSKLIMNNVQVINMSMGMNLRGDDGKKDKELTLGKKLEVKNSARKTYKLLARYLSKPFLIVTSSGNNGTVNSHDTNYNNMFCNIAEPALKNRIIVVGNADCSNEGGKWKIQRCTSSSYKGGRVDVMAPGVSVYSTMPGNQYSHLDSSGKPMTGTSMASAFVAGLAGLVWEANPDLPPERVKQIICDTATIPVEGSSIKMVNAEAAILKALGGGYDSRENSVTFVFVDETTNAGLSTDKLTIRFDSYTGNGGDQGWIGQSLQDELIDSKLVMPLNYGEYTLTFTPDGYKKATISVTVDADAHKVPIHIFMTPDTQKTHTLRLHFTDKSTAKKLKLLDVFGESYDEVYLGLMDEAENFIIDGFLHEANDSKTDGMYLENDEIVFTGLKSGTYLIAFDAESSSYTLPEKPLKYKLEEDTILRIDLKRLDGADKSQTLALDGTFSYRDTDGRLKPIPYADVKMVQTGVSSPSAYGGTVTNGVLTLDLSTPGAGGSLTDGTYEVYLMNEGQRNSNNSSISLSCQSEPLNLALTNGDSLGEVEVQLNLNYYFKAIDASTNTPPSDGYTWTLQKGNAVIEQGTSQYSYTSSYPWANCELTIQAGGYKDYTVSLEPYFDKDGHVSFKNSACFNYLRLTPLAEQDTLSGSCGDNVYWSIQDGVLTISGTGNMTNYYDSTDEPWWGQSIHSVVIESGVTGVGFLAFSGQRGLRSVYIAETVEYIGKAAFGLCDNIQSITFMGNPPRYAQGMIVNESDKLFLIVDGATAYYPAGNPAWTEEARSSYGSNITWIPR